MKLMENTIKKKLTTLREHFWTHFGSTDGIRAFQAPGRVNLIGEHTDYNLGFVLPVAVDRAVFAVARARDDRQVRLVSRQFKEPVEFDLDSIVPEKGSWGNYPKGVAHVLVQKGHRLRGADVVFDGTVPLGAGLGSSAALEVISAVVLTSLSGIELDRVEAAKLCRKAENEFVGVSCGIMDQFISALGEAGSALFLDCRDLSCRAVPLSIGDARIVVADTKVRRGLAATEYHHRVEECKEGVRLLQQKLPDITSLRDVTVEEVNRYRVHLPVNIWKRCLHVVSENRRVEKAVEALEKREIVEFGSLMRGSHFSLRDLYQVSCPELDLLVQTALRVPGVIGSRMTGAGFGGSTVSLVEEDAVAGLKAELTRKYRDVTGVVPDIYPCTISGGASELAWHAEES